MTNYEKRLTALETRVNILEADNEKLKAENTELKKELVSIKQEMGDMSDAWEASEKRVIELEDQNTVLKEKVSYLEAKIAEFQPIFDYCKLFYRDVVDLIKGKVSTKDRAMDNILKCAKEDLGIDE